MAANDQTHKITDQQSPAPTAGNDAAGREIDAQIQAFKMREKGAAGSDKPSDTTLVNTDTLPSGRKVERTEDGFPVGGRANFESGEQALIDASMWSRLQNKEGLSEHEKFAAGTMGLQLGRRYSDPLRDDLTMKGTWDERVQAAKKTFETWTKCEQILAGKLNPEEQKLATKVSDELQTELWQEEWRKKRFSR